MVLEARKSRNMAPGSGKGFCAMLSHDRMPKGKRRQEQENKKGLISFE
jgi:hypothetical protein